MSKTYYNMKDKIKALKKEFNVDFKNLRACNYQTNSSITAYMDITTNFIYVYDCFINSWIEDKDDLYNYTSFEFEDKNYELLNVK